MAGRTAIVVGDLEIEAGSALEIARVDSVDAVGDDSDAVVLDLRASPGPLASLRERLPSAPLVAITDDEDQAIAAIAAGVDEVVGDPGQLSPAIERAIARRQVRGRQRRGAARLMAVLAHDMRTPLHVARMAAELLEGDEIRPIAAKIDRAVTLLGELAEDLSMAAALERGSYHPAAAPCSLSGLVRQVCDSRQQRARRAGVELDIDLEALPRLEVDETEVAHAIARLLDNAIEASERGGAVHVSLGRRDGAQLVRVTDRGARVAATTAGLSDPSTWTKRSERGANLALAVAHGIARAHGGRLEIERRAGENRLAITLPA